MVPTPHEVEAVIQEYEIEDEREKEALRKFWEHERAKAYGEVTGQHLLHLFGWILLIAAGIAALVWWRG